MHYEPPEQDLRTYCIECGEAIPEENIDTFEDLSCGRWPMSGQDATVYTCANCGHVWTE